MITIGIINDEILPKNEDDVNDDSVAGNVERMVSMESGYKEK
jgi:hypothetical protein